tara:strand:+ start:1900 stop:2907 length:1008 start_codon:yes stop_codon:yes gene_type:complete
MPDLDKSREITDISFDHNGAHLAVCHKAQGGSANLAHDALIMKGSLPVSDEIIMSLSDVYSKEHIEKMSYRNLRNQLESMIEGAYRAAGFNYPYVWVVDLDEDTVVYSFEENKYAIKFMDGDNGVEILGDIKEAIEHTIYLSVDGRELLLKHAGLPSTFEVDNNIIPDVETKTNTKIDKGIKTMSDGKEVIVKSQDELNELVKAQAGLLNQESITKAVNDALALDKADRAQVELEKSTVSIVKSYAFVKEEDSKSVVKAILASGEDSVAFLKALDSAKEAIETVTAEKETIKKEFGEKENANTTEVKDVTLAGGAEAFNKALKEKVDATLLAKAQ